MADVDLLFQQLPIGQPADLVFGESDNLADADAFINVTFPLAFSATLGRTYDATITVAFPPLTFAASGNYDVYVDRPLVGHTESRHQVAAQLPVGFDTSMQDAAPAPAGKLSRWAIADVLQASTDGRFSDALRTSRRDVSNAFQQADSLGSPGVGATFQDGLRDRRIARQTDFQAGIRSITGRDTGFQDRHRDRRPVRVAPWGEARDLRNTLLAKHQKALPLLRALDGRFQKARRPPAGVRPTEPPGPLDPCYLPDPNLLFSQIAAVDGQLVFICERHTDPEQPPATVIVPIRSVYVVINNINLRRVVGNVTLPVLRMSMSIDADSWTWGFNASLPGAALADVLPSGGNPVEVEAEINGTLYRFLIESVARERAFGQDSINVRGRGKSALLASPYAPVQTFTNNIARTAQQLMSDVLTFNGVPLGWSIDWDIEDWLVPTGAFNVRGTYIEGLTAIAGAAGAYLQPHNVNNEIRVLPRYPVAPWQWGTVTPDFELPSAVTVRESIEWIDRPNYNRVFVSGTSQGVLGQVTRSGTAGDLAAPMVTDALITEAAAARQRGIAVLGDTGRQARVGLRLPVLTETGVIKPGAFVRYNDNGDQLLGIVRSTNVDAGMPEVWQQLEVEVHL